LGLKGRSKRGVEDIHCFYSHRKSRILGCLVNVVSIRERGHARTILLGKPESKRTLGRSNHRWEDNIKVDLQDIRGIQCFCSHRKSRILKWLVNVVSIRERGHARTILLGKPESKRALGKSNDRWEDNIKIDLQDIRGSVDWDDLAQDRDK